MSNDYYVGVKRGKEFRRSLLIASKNILQVLRGNSILESLREQKKYMTLVLRQEIQEIMLLLDKLDELLPEDIIKKSPVKPKVEIKKEIKPLTEKQEPVEPAEEELEVRPEFELDRLEKALSRVEEKLKYLS